MYKRQVFPYDLNFLSIDDQWARRRGVSPEVHHYLLRLGDVEKEAVSLHQPTSFSTAQRYEFSLIVTRPVSDMSSESLT